MYKNINAVDRTDMELVTAPRTSSTLVTLSTALVLLRYNAVLSSPNDEGIVNATCYLMQVVWNTTSRSGIKYNTEVYFQLVFI